MELKTLFDNIADAIREKDGTKSPIPASEFPERILAIPSGGLDGVTLESIQIVVPPNKIDYIEGDTFDPAGMRVAASFSNGQSMYVNYGDLIFEPSGPLGTGIEAVAVKFQWGLKQASAEQTVVVHMAATFGVMWDYGNPSSVLTRLNLDNDPNKLATVDVTKEPVAAVGNGTGSSPFDNYLPWSGMEEYNVVNGSLIKQGESGFSRTANDTVVYIPEFWYKVIDDSANSKRYYYISNAETEGFEKHPGSGKYVSRYDAGAGYVSKSGLTPLVSVTRATARSGAKTKGTNWRLYDFQTYCAVVLLYLVEYADWNSQAKVGRGVVDVSAAVASGATDSMTYHTGYAGGTNGKTAMQYRHIENLWGNIWQFVDGINFNSRAAYMCQNPAQYADDTATGYTSIGLSLPSSNGYTTKLGHAVSYPWALCPSAVGGSETTYVTDNSYNNTGWCILIVGGAGSLVPARECFASTGATLLPTRARSLPFVSFMTPNKAQFIPKIYEK